MAKADLNILRLAYYEMNIDDDIPKPVAVDQAVELAKKYGASFIQLDSVAGHLTPEDDAVFGESIAKWRAGYDGFVIGGVRFKYQPTSLAAPWRKICTLA